MTKIPRVCSDSHKPNSVTAVTIGDVCGIGPEVTFRALTRFPEERFLLFGPKTALETAVERYGRLARNIALRPVGDCSSGLFECGRVEAAAGRASFEAVAAAARSVLDGEAEALVTAPISKAAWEAAGIKDPGHTELLGRLSKAQPVMAFFGRDASGTPWRIALLTIHSPLRRVPELVEKERLVRTLEIVVKEMRDRFGFVTPRLAVLGLNPHAGEKGRIGSEEKEILEPVLGECRNRWRNVIIEGPLPADTAFTERVRRRFDLVVGMYHDQVLPVFKAVTGGTGVNVTLGLPFLRVSPDHGTAFDIAGKGEADESSMVSAIEWAVEFSERRRR